MALKFVFLLVAVNVLYVSAADTNLEFENESLTVQESDNVIPIAVLRGGKELNAITQIAFATKQGTAKSGVDYVGVSGVLVFLPGEDKKIIHVEVVDDDEPEEDEYFTVELQSVTVDNAKNDAVQLGTKKTLKVVIKDNDQ